MKLYGGREVYKLGIGDDDQDDIEAYFNKWKEGIWPSLLKKFKGVEKTTQDIQVTDIDIEIEDDSQLSQEPKSTPYEGIISSFHKEKKFSEQAKLVDKYQFKALNFMSYDTLRIGKPKKYLKKSSKFSLQKKIIFL